MTLIELISKLQMLVDQDKGRQWVYARCPECGCQCTVTGIVVYKDGDVSIRGKMK